MSLKIKRLLNRAKKLEKKGELEKAETVYASILTTSPNNSIAKKGLESIKLKNKKINLQDQIEEVVKLYSSGLFEESINAINLLNIDNPNNPILFNLSGACYSAIGPIESAIRDFEKAISLKPDYAEAHFNMGVVFQKNKIDDDAIKCYEQALNINHAYPQALNNIGMIYFKQKNFDSAIKKLEWAVAYNPNYAEAQNNLGAVFQELMMHKKAKEQFEKAIEINPVFTQALNNLGTSCEIFGLNDQAVDYYTKAITSNPSYTDAHRNLSNLKIFKKNDTQIKQMELIYSKTDLNSYDKRNLSFALAKAYEDLGDFEKFFKFLNSGNHLRKQELNYSISSSEKTQSNIIKTFKNPPDVIPKSTQIKSEIYPIFIVGMPRSGTTLVEQIISSHRKVYGAGELNNLQNIVAPILSNHEKIKNNFLTKKEIITIREQYLASLIKLKTPDKFITDKMPINFRNIGFILSAIPEAKIVHVKRDAIATCWSNYKHYFSSGNGFTFNQADLSRFYRLYIEMMDFWHKLFPNKIYDLSYEKLTENQEIETKKLLSHCNLEWDENCLKFYENDRAIKTVSSSQVRKKMYQGSSEAWKQYEPFIKTLVDGLKSY